MPGKRANARPTDFTVRRGSGHTSDNQGGGKSNPNTKYGVGPAHATSGRAGSPYRTTRMKAGRRHKKRF
jgi:hypothetical protein